MSTLPVLAKKSVQPYVARIPGSKSYTNRALVLAAQRTGSTRVANGLVCDDTERLAEALDAFEGLTVERTADGFRTTRTREVLGPPSRELFMGAAGTPARFMLSFAASAEGSAVVTGVPRLCERPMKDVLDSLRAMGVEVEFEGEPDHLPARIHGGPVTTREWTIRGDVSSQFTSSLLLHASRQKEGPVVIRVQGNQVSKPYVDMTLAMMNACGIPAERTAEDEITVSPRTPEPDVIQVEPDASGMSYFLAAAAVTGTTVEIPGIGGGSAQGDVGLARAFEQMGCELELLPDRIRLTGGPLRGIDIDMETMPDVVLTLAAVAARAEGPTCITNIANLRLKECDRIHAAAAELGRLGVDVEQGDDWLVVKPSGSFRPARIECYDDHRVAMSFAVLGLVVDGVTIDDPECVKKSFPDFWDELGRFRAHHGQ